MLSTCVYTLIPEWRDRRSVKGGKEKQLVNFVAWLWNMKQSLYISITPCRKKKYLFLLYSSCPVKYVENAQRKRLHKRKRFQTRWASLSRACEQRLARVKDEHAVCTRKRENWRLYQEKRERKREKKESIRKVLIVAEEWKQKAGRFLRSLPQG